MKQLFTLGLVLLTLATYAGKPDSPFGLKKMNPKVEKLIKESRIHLTDAQLRVAASGFPDSALSYSWDGTAWELETQARINYTAFGKIASIIFYFDLGGTSIPVFSYQYTYDGAGRTTRIEQIQTLPGMPPVIAGRFTMNYDAQGNQTSMLFYEDDNNTLVLSSGDSLQINYTAGVPTQATRFYWDDMAATPTWTAETRFSNFTFDASGLPTAVVFNEFTNGSFVETERYTEVGWKMGYPGFSASFGGLIDIGQFIFTELPLPDDFFGEPTDFITEIKDGANWVLDSRSQSTGAVGSISLILAQNRTNGSWVDAYRSNLTYTSGRLTLIFSEEDNAGSWVPSDRYTWAYDAQGNMTLAKEEYYINSSWTQNSGSQNTFTYTSDNKVFRWISQSWDSFTMAYVNELKRDYFFGAFPQSVVTNTLAELQVYPNPVQDKLNIRLASNTSGMLRAEIFTIQGQLVSSQALALNVGINQHQLEVQHLAKGLYQLRLQTNNGMETIRFVK